MPSGSTSSKRVLLRSIRLLLLLLLAVLWPCVAGIVEALRALMASASMLSAGMQAQGDLGAVSRHVESPASIRLVTLVLRGRVPGGRRTSEPTSDLIPSSCAVLLDGRDCPPRPQELLLREREEGSIGGAQPLWRRSRQGGVALCSESPWRTNRTSTRASRLTLVPTRPRRPGSLAVSEPAEVREGGAAVAAGA
jgi:hypothetical protein